MMMERDGRTAYNPYCQTAKHDTDAMEASGWSGQGVAAECELRKGAVSRTFLPHIQSLSTLLVRGEVTAS